MVLNINVTFIEMNLLESDNVEEQCARVLEVVVGI